jgi:putative SOS response-associated peptidase YedK
MCGRYTIHSSKEALEKHFGVHSDNEELFQADYNVSPGAHHPVCLMPKPGKKGIGGLYWGLIPEWATDKSIAFKLMNARSETLDQKPSFQKSFERHRCLIPANGFYEWKKEGSSKRPYYIFVPERPLFAFAGLYARWFNPETNQYVWSYTIITTEANEKLKPLHDRMPVILQERDYEEWLSPTKTDTQGLKRLFVGLSDNEVDLFEVSDAVNSTRNNNENLILPYKSELF